MLGLSMAGCCEEAISMDEQMEQVSIGLSKGTS
jgi:hypothetical protein